MKLLQRLAYDEVKAAKIFSSGIIDVILKAHEDNKFPLEVLTELFSLFNQLTKSEEANSALGERVCPLVVDNMNLYINHEKGSKLLQKGAQALSNFAFLELNAEFIISSGAIDCIILLLIGFKGDNDIVVDSFRLISNIALINEENRKFLLKKDLVTHV